MKVERLERSWDEVFALLDLHWTQISATIELARGYGVDWRELSTPFGVRVDGELVAHVGVFDLPELAVDGQKTQVLGIHAVCTRAEHRRRGLARAALEAALAHAEARTPRQLLFATQARVYTGLGFRAAAPTRYELDLGRPLSGTGSLRSLDLADPIQRTRLRELCRSRITLSTRLAVVDGGALLVLDELLGTRGRGGRLWWLDEQTIVAGQLFDGELHLFDLICVEPRSLAELLLAWPGRVRRVYVYFEANALELGGALEAHLARSERADQALRTRPVHGDDTPMVRGPSWSSEEGFALSPLARC